MLQDVQSNVDVGLTHPPPLLSPLEGQTSNRTIRYGAEFNGVFRWENSVRPKGRCSFGFGLATLHVPGKRLLYNNLTDIQKNEDALFGKSEAAVFHGIAYHKAT